MKNQALLLLFPFFFSLGVAGDEMVHHVVLVIDRSASVRKKASNSQLRRLFTRDLAEGFFSPGRVIPDQVLLKEGDYFSLTGFGMTRKTRTSTC